MSRRTPRSSFGTCSEWTPWAKQTEIARAVAAAVHGEGPRRVAVRSGNGVGKTALAARLMLWALYCHESSVVVTTAPTQRQVTELLWREARSAYYRARVDLGGVFYEGQPRWDLGPRRYAIGVSPEHTRAEAFQGFHADLIVFLVDEASGIPPAHWEAIKGSLLAGRAAVLAIGNPTRLEGEFYDAFHGRASLWRRLHISAFDTPNLTGGDVPGLVTPAAVAEAARDWGEESPLYQIRVLGEFPRRRAISWCGSTGSSRRRRPRRRAAASPWGSTWRAAARTRRRRCCWRATVWRGCSGGWVRTRCGRSPRSRAWWTSSARWRSRSTTAGSAAAWSTGCGSSTYGSTR